ncbi:unnamed protein product, partial [Ixodes persulcatus]
VGTPFHAVRVDSLASHAVAAQQRVSGGRSREGRDPRCANRRCFCASASAAHQLPPGHSCESRKCRPLPVSRRCFLVVLPPLTLFFGRRRRRTPSRRCLFAGKCFAGK